MIWTSWVIVLYIGRICLGSGAASSPYLDSRVENAPRFRAVDARFRPRAGPALRACRLRAVQTPTRMTMPPASLVTRIWLPVAVAARASVSISRQTARVSVNCSDLISWRASRWIDQLEVVKGHDDLIRARSLRDTRALAKQYDGKIMLVELRIFMTCADVGWQSGVNNCLTRSLIVPFTSQYYLEGAGKSGRHVPNHGRLMAEVGQKSTLVRGSGKSIPPPRVRRPARRAAAVATNAPPDGG